MIVELAGLPGSGKTTVAKRLVESTPSIRRAFAVVSLPPVLSHPGQVRALLRWGGLLPGAEWPSWVRLCLRRLAEDRFVSEVGTTLLVEEGAVHHTWRSLYRHPGLSRRPWEQLVETGPPLVVLRVSRALRHERVQGKRRRGPTNRDLAAGQPDEATWGRAERLMDQVMAAAKRDRRVVEIPADGDLEAVLGQVKEAIAALG
jgi:hypothetical protein